MTKGIFYDNLQIYAEQISAREPELLTRVRKETEKLPGRKMLSSVLQGRLLALFSHLLRPKSILEIGTYTGYSTLCLAEGLDEGGVLHTLDRDQGATFIAKRYVGEAGRLSNVHFYTGNALDLLPRLQGPFDLVFIDADKKNNGRYYDMVIPHVRLGGMIVVDNLFWSGKVLDKVYLSQDIRTRALFNFAQKIKEDKGVEQICLPVRDGLLVVRKVF